MDSEEMKSEDYQGSDLGLNALDSERKENDFNLRDSKQEKQCLHRLLTL